MARARNQKKRYRKRRGLRLLYLLLSFFLIVAAIFASCMFFFRVEQIQVTGNSHYSQEDILNTANISPNANLFLLSRSSVEKRILKERAYVKTVTLHRQLPTTLLIEVQESTPAAVVRSDSGYWFIDGDTKVLEAVDESMSADYAAVEGLTILPPTVGQPLQVAEGEERRYSALRALLRALTEQGIAKEVSWIDLSGEVDIEMSYSGRFTVKLPIRAEGGVGEQASDSYDLKIRALKEIVANLNETDRGIIDLGNKDGSFCPR